MLVLQQYMSIDNTSVFLSSKLFVNISYLSFQYSLSIPDQEFG